MEDGSFGSGIAECGIFAERADADACDGAGDDYSRGGLAGCRLGEERGES